MLKRITLHLARTPEYPEGSIRHGYEIIAPLDAEGRLDIKLFSVKKDHCRVRSFWGNEPVRYGRLEHRPGGVGGATWENFTTTAPITMMKPVIGLAAINSSKGNICRSGMMRAS